MMKNRSDATGSDRLRYTILEGDQIHNLRMILKLKMGCSTRLLRKIRETEGGLLLNGQPARMNAKGRPGDRLTVRLPREESYFDPEPIPLSVLYEDADLLAVDKQPGVVVHPTKGHPCHTVANAVMYHYQESGQSGKIRFINRLDRDTSGVLLIGKNAYCQEAFTRQAAAGTVRKQYLAITRGLPPEERGVIDLPIGQPQPDDVRRRVTDSGYPAKTAYRVRETFPGGFGLLELQLFSGRTHQIRVHLAHIGCPIVGDSLYGVEMPAGIDRQALHAEILEFEHPVGHQRLFLTAPLPEDMRRLAERLRRPMGEDNA